MRISDNASVSRRVVDVEFLTIEAQEPLPSRRLGITYNGNHEGKMSRLQMGLHKNKRLLASFICACCGASCGGAGIIKAHG